MKKFRFLFSNFIVNNAVTGFEILAFPCNQFLSQEPGNGKQIQETVCTLFKAEFPIFNKVSMEKQIKFLYGGLKSFRLPFLPYSFSVIKYLTFVDHKCSSGCHCLGQIITVRYTHCQL